MNYSNIYGEGQIFAFSALDGESLYSNDFPGTLIKDKIGIKFYYKDTRILFNDHDSNNALFSIVSSDYIDYKYQNKRYVFLYLKSHVIVGLSDCISVAGKYREYKENDITYQIFKNKVTALYKNDDRFVFVYAKNKKEAKNLIDENVNFDIESIINKKIRLIDSTINDNFINEKLACKCLSVMKTQLYSKEGKHNTIWSTPDRVPHKKMWLWDSIFHAIGFRHVDTSLAKDLIESLFIHQLDNGFIPHMMDPYKQSKITQPPVIMYGALKVYESSKDLDFLKRVYEHNKKFINWVHNNRRYSNLYLYSWNLSKKKYCRCDESGMDNSPRFDINTKLYAIDFCCYMANETRLMKDVATILNIKEDIEYYKSFNEKIIKDTNDYLYSNKKHFYFDYNIEKNKIHEVYSVASFLPLFSKVASLSQAKELVNYLNDSDYFKTDLMIPTIAKKDPLFGQDMWKGPVWINFNYMIIEGLKNYGFEKLAIEIQNQTIKAMNDIYLKTGVIFEFYDSLNELLPNKLNRKGTPVEPYNFKVKMQTIRDYGWSTTLLFDMLYK